MISSGVGGGGKVGREEPEKKNLLAMLVFTVDYSRRTAMQYFMYNVHFPLYFPVADVWG